MSVQIRNYKSLKKMKTKRCGSSVVSATVCTFCASSFTVSTSCMSEQPKEKKKEGAKEVKKKKKEKKSFWTSKRTI